MKKLQRDEIGYPGSIGDSIRLNASETKAIRQALAKATEAMHISQIGKQAGIDPRKTGQLSEFISSYLAGSTREVAMCFDHTEKGKRFTGWKMTEHGLDLHKNVG